MRVGVLLIIGHHPRPARLTGLTHPIQRLLKRRFPVVLKRQTRQFRRIAQQRRINPLLLIRIGMQHNVMPIRIIGGKIGGHRLPLFGTLRILLAQVPVQRQTVSEPRNQLPVVQLPLRPDRPAIQRLRDIIIILCLLRLHMQVQSVLLRMVKHNLPLIQPGTVISQLLLPPNKRPHVIAISARVIRQKRDRIHSFAGQVIHRPDYPLAPAAPPGRIALFPIPHMGRKPL